MTLIKRAVKKIISYFQGVLEEMRKVTWPSRQTTTRYSIIVITLSISVAILFGVLDAVFTLGLEGLLNIAG